MSAQLEKLIQDFRAYEQDPSKPSEWKEGIKLVSHIISAINLGFTADGLIPPSLNHTAIEQPSGDLMAAAKKTTTFAFQMGIPPTEQVLAQPVKNARAGQATTAPLTSRDKMMGRLAKLRHGILHF